MLNRREIEEAEKGEMETLYKYRSLSNSMRFISILLEKKLYGALFDELNDPMEGYFSYSKELSSDLKKDLTEIRKNTYICSFSQKHNIGIMWSHYADEHKGCCIELNVTAKSWEKVKIKYDNNVLVACDVLNARDLFERKTTQWESENEIRYIKKAKSQNDKSRNRYLTVSISKIYMGYKMSSKDFNYWKKLIGKLNPQIEVKKITKSEINFGYEK